MSEAEPFIVLHGSASFFTYEQVGANGLQPRQLVTNFTISPLCQTGQIRR
jgi:hypothetical protein